jgi:tryptophan synthase alpha chain
LISDPPLAPTLAAPLVSPDLEMSLRQARDGGRKLLVPYLMAGASPDWLEILAAVAGAGADAVEVGIPFSDPVMDGPVIQEAGERALAAGTTPAGVVASLGRLSFGIPLAVMTYYNLAYRAGEVRFARELAAAGVSGAILPDLELEESLPWREAAAGAGVRTVLLAAPTTPLERMEAICAAASGFVYGVGLMGVTGERQQLAASAMAVASRLKSVTDLPVLIGVGVSTPEQAASLSEVADGVVIGSVLVRRHLEGATASEMADLVHTFRQALD